MSENRNDIWIFRYFSRKMIPAMLVLDNIPEFRLAIIHLDTFLFSLYFYLHHMNTWILKLDEFFRVFVIISNTPSPNHHWPEMGAMGLPWLSIGTHWNVRTIIRIHWNLNLGTFRPRFQAPSVSPQLRGNVALKAFVEKKIWLTMNFWFFMT